MPLTESVREKVMERLRKEDVVDAALPGQLLQLAIMAAQNNEMAEAHQLCDQVLSENPDHVDAILWQSVLSENSEDKICLLQRALGLSPDDRRAKTLLRWAQSRRTNGKPASLVSEIDFLTACPHLGSAGDPASRFAYPCPGNVCHAEETKRRRSRAVGEETQERVCLTTSHLVCPTYCRVQARNSEAGRPRSSQLRGYFEFFGLEEEPFSIVPMARFFFSTRQHHGALRICHQVIVHRQGLAVLSAPVGTGKTLTMQRLYEELFHDPGYQVGLLQHSAFRTEYALMQGILQALHIRPQRKRSLHDLEEAFRDHVLRQTSSRGGTIVLLFDEAHQMRYRALRQLRKILDLHAGGQQMVQIVLAGQPALLAKLARLPALQDRITAQATLGPLAPSDVKGLIWARLREAGAQKRIFTSDAVRAITEIAHGHARRINVLCMNCMWRAHEENRRVIDHGFVSKVASLGAGPPLDQASSSGRAGLASLLTRLQSLGQRAGFL